MATARARRALGEDELLQLRKILSGVARGGERWGRRKIAAMLAGDLEGLPESLATLSTTGLLSKVSVKRIGDWLDAAVAAGLLAATDDAYRTLSLTRRGRDVMAGRATDVALALPVPAGPRPKRAKTAKGSRPAPLPADPELYEALRDWRRREAARRSVPAYVVLHDRTLAALAAARPASLTALAEVPGIGPAKLAAYGSEILSVLAGEV